MRILVTGGVKSGKSRYALELARSRFPLPRRFIATAAVMDEEMAERVEKHRAERRGSDGSDDFLTIEETVDIHAALARGSGPVLLDCLPMWVNNLMHYGREAEFDRILDSFLDALPEHAAVVTNETGLGNIPFDPRTRRYNRLLAEANRRTAAVFDQVVLMVCGIPLTVK